MPRHASVAARKHKSGWQGIGVAVRGTMVIRDAGGGRHRSAAGTMASSSSAYRSTGSKSIKTTDTRSTRLVRITQTGLKKTRRSGKTKSEGEQPTKSILMKKKSGGLLRRKETKIARSVTFKDEVVNEYSNGDDYSTIASERTYSSAESSRSGSTKSPNSRVRSPPRRQPTLDPIEEGGETSTQERDPPEPSQSPGSDDAFFHLGALPAIKGWSPQDFSMPTFHDATRNMNSWFNAHTSSNRAVNEAVPLIAPCSAAAAAASIAPSPTNAIDRPKGLIPTPSSASSVGLNVENEVVAASAPTTITSHEETKEKMPPNTAPQGKPPLHPTSAPRCPPSPTRSIVTPAEPKYGNFQPDEESLQESIEVSEATPKAGNAVTYHSSTGISLSSGSGASDAPPTIGHTPLVIEVPSIIISNESNGEGGDLDAIEVASIPSLGGSSDAMSNASNQNSQNSPPSLEEKASVHSDQGSYVSQTPMDNAPSDTQSSKTSVSSGCGGDSLASLSMSVEEKISPSTFTHSTVSHLIESANTVEKRAQTRERTQETTERSSPQANENEESSSVGPKNTMEIIKQMDKPSRQNQHKRSISLPKYFDRSQQYAPLTAAAESKVRNEPIKSGHSTSDTIAPNGANNNSAAIAQVIKEAKETSAESIINIHVHLNSNEVRPVTNVTSSGATAVAEAPLSPEREVRGSDEKKNDEATVSTGDNISREEHNEADKLQTSVEEVKKTEVAQVEIAESVEMDMDELALLSTRQCIMECRDPLSSQNPDPVIKKPRRQPRKGTGCATILSNGAAKCIRHCAEGVDEPHGCQLFSNIFSCANEADALGDIDWDSDESDDSTAQHRERRVKRSTHKKKKKHRPTREKREKEEDPSVVFDSGGLSFRLAVDLPGSDEISNNGPSQVDDESRHGEDHESRDSDWEQDTIVMRRHDSSSIDSEDDKRRTTRESRQRQRHHRHKKSSSSHPDRSRRSRSRSRSASRSKRDQSPSRSRSRSRSKSAARKERRRKDSNAGAHAHRNHRHPREESNRATHNRKVPPARPPALDERPLSPKRKRSMKDKLRHRSHSRR